MEKNCSDSANLDVKKKSAGKTGRNFIFCKKIKNMLKY